MQEYLAEFVVSFLGAFAALCCTGILRQLGRLALCPAAYWRYLKCKGQIMKRGYAEVIPDIDDKTTDLDALVIGWFVEVVFEATNHNYTTGSNRVFTKIWKKYWK